nr:transcription factor bHLH91-like [Tanacetum cinerariifolium]
MLDNSDMFEPNTYNLDPNTLSQLLNNQEPINWTNTNNNLNLNNLDVQTNQPDLLNLFQLPKCSSSICFTNPSHMDQVQMYHDHHGTLLGMHNNNNVGVTQNVPYIRELLNNGFSLNGCNASIFGEMDMENNGGCDGILEFGKNGNGNGGNKDNVKHFATEKHRRQQLNGKFDALKSLVPNPSKADRASVVGDAIKYINELKGTVEELKHLVDRKRCNRGRMKKHKTEDDSTLDVESIYTMSNSVVGDITHDQQAYNGNSSSSMRSSMVQRKSKHTEIDVRIIDDEVTIKLVQQKRINCLLLVSKVLDELQLDLHHVAGGLIGDFYSYLFNTKICEGSSVYATAIANKLIEVVDKQYAAISVTSSY